MSFTFRVSSASTGGTGATFAPNTNPPTTPGTGFSFGGSSANNSNNTNSTNTSTNTSANASTNNPTNATVQTTLTVPDYEDVFVGGNEWPQITKLLHESFLEGMGDDEERMVASHGLAAILNASNDILKMLTNPPIIDFEQPDPNLRQKLQQQPLVELDGQPATLTPVMLQHVFSIADDLRVSEASSLRIYAQLRRHVTIENEASIIPAARHLYFGEKVKPLIVLVDLLRNRLRVPSSHPLLVTTDVFITSGNLIPNLINLIRQYSQRIHEILLWLHSHRRRTSTTGGSGAAESGSQLTNPIESAEYHANIWRLQRQKAVESIFFVAYHTILETNEVVAIIDLIRDLSNPAGSQGEGLRLLDPFFHVPSPYESAAYETPWPQGTNTLLVEKSFFVWQQEMITQIYQSGQPWLLRCLGVLITTVVGTLSTKHDSLYDRHTHSYKTDVNLTTSIELENQFTIEAASKWQRKDIWGLLSASFALLQSEPVLASPRARRSKQWRSCLEAPTTCQSFTFARVTLLPALQIPLREEDDPFATFTSKDYDISEFLLFAMANFGARYLDVMCRTGDRTISRAQWLQDAEEDLRLRRSHRDEHFQFEAWSGTRQNVEEIPSSVDLCQRPDCMDDIVIFCANICNLNPDFTLPFWSQEIETISLESTEQFPLSPEGNSTNSQTQVKLALSHAIQDLEHQQSEDDSLRPSYLSMLAALAQKSQDGTIDGASIIHSHMMLRPDPNFRQYTTYERLIEVCRHYAYELSRVGVSTSQNTIDDAFHSASDFYHVSSTHEPADSAFSGLYNPSSAAQTIAELGEENTFILLSNLYLLRNLSKNLVEARLAILNAKLSTHSSARSDYVGRNTSLNILFLLSSMPLSPEVRGVVLETIAAVLTTDSNTYKAKEISEMALMGWGLLEQNQILPIYLLDQYPSVKISSLDTAPGLKFPPSSTAMAASSSKSQWIPPDTRYSILYEMEYVEATCGKYPSTEGFLRLLNSLIKANGCPIQLGYTWRLRTGCGPYIEYVAHYILPRIFGNYSSMPPLQFRCMEDKSRLICAALDVVKSVTCMYVVPTIVQQRFFEDNNQDLTKTVAAARASFELDEVSYENSKNALREAANNKLGIEMIATNVTDCADMARAQAFVTDFFSKASPVLQHRNEYATSVQNPTILPSVNISTTNSFSSMPLSIPLPKTPSFATVTDILSSTGGDLLQALIAVITDSVPPVLCGSASDKYALTYSLFGATQPTFTSAKVHFKGTSISYSRQDLIEEMKPTTHNPSWRSAVYWTEHSMNITLCILCAAVAREDALLQVLSLQRGAICYSPHLGFHPEASHRSTSSWNIRVSRVAELLFNSSLNYKVLSALTKAVGTNAIVDEQEQTTAGAAVSLLFYMDRTLSTRGGLLTAIKNSMHSKFAVMDAFAFRLKESAENATNAFDYQIFLFIIKFLMSDIKAAVNQTFALMLLGFTKDDSSTGEEVEFKQQDCTDCFDATISILRNSRFITEDETAELAAYALQLLTYLIQIASTNSDLATKIFQRFNDDSFWLTTLSSVIGQDKPTRPYMQNDNVLHSLAWIMEGLSEETNLLFNSYMSITGRKSDLSIPVPYRSSLIEILSVLCSSESMLLSNIAAEMTVRKLTYQNNNLYRVETVRELKTILQGPFDDTVGFYVFDLKKVKSRLQLEKGSAANQDIFDWCHSFNRSVSRGCAASRLTDTFTSLVGVVLLVQKVLEAGLTFLSPELNLLLAPVLEHLICDDDANVFDEICYTNATKNLARCVMLIADAVDQTDQEIDEVPNMCVALCRAIVCSGFRSYAGPQETLQAKRTSWLCGALAQLLKSLPDDYVLRWDHVPINKMSVIILRIAVARFDEEASQNSILATFCLANVLRAYAENNGHTFIETRISYWLNEPLVANQPVTIIESIMHLLAKMDPSITALVDTFCQIPSGVIFLYKANVFDAMKNASSKYIEIEGQHLASSDISGSILAAPDFLLGHLSIIACILDKFADIETNTIYYREVSNQASEILLNYQFVFDRLLLHYPLESDTTSYFIDCLLLLVQLNNVSNIVLVETIDIAIASSCSSVISRMIKSTIPFALQLAEYPLPPSMQPAYPKRISYDSFHSKGFGTPNIKFLVQNRTSWWDSRVSPTRLLSHSQIQDRTETFITIDLCQAGVEVAMLVSQCLRLAQYTNVQILLSKEDSICRTLFQCTNACKILCDTQNEMESLSSYGDDNYNENSLHYWRILYFEKLVQVIEDILLLSLLSVRSSNDKLLKLGDVRNVNTKPFSTLYWTLNQLNLSEMMLTFHTIRNSDENEPGQLALILRSLQIELDKL